MILPLESSAMVSDVADEFTTNVGIDNVPGVISLPNVNSYFVEVEFTKSNDVKTDLSNSTVVTPVISRIPLISVELL